MKRISFLLFILFISFCSLQAQEEWQPLASVSAFQEQLKKEAAAIKSIESDFTQEKYMDVFEEKVVSQGRFYYQKENKIRMDYTRPLDYRIIINGTKLKMVSEEKSSIVNLGSNPLMNEMKGMLSACMIGDLQSIGASYQLEYFETPATYIVRVRPVSKSVQAYIRQIIITFDKKDLSVQKLRLAENTNDYTEYWFSGKKYNTLPNDEKFIIR